MNKLFACIVCASAVVAASAADRYYVDCNRPDDSGAGDCETNAFRTIQAAVDKCKSTSVREIIVLPGVYKEGANAAEADGLGRSRIYVNGNGSDFFVKLVSRDGADKTVIEGQHDPNSDWYGMGPNAVRCITVRGGNNTIIKGFTIRNGATAGTAASRPDHATTRGGAILGTGDVGSFTLVDCVISNNAGTRGGAIFGGRAVRCRITDNRASNFGAAGRECALYQCLLARNRIVYGDNGVGTVAYPRAIVNCTFADNDGVCFAQLTSSSDYGPVCNCALLNAAGAGDSALAPAQLHNCVSRGTAYGENGVLGTEFDVFSPVTDDYRAIVNGASDAAGDAKWLDNVPEGYRYKSLDGETLPSEGAIAAGCFANLAAPATAPVQFAANWKSGYALCDGKLVVMAMQHYRSETWPSTFTYQFVPTNGQSLTRYYLDKVDARVPPDMDDKLVRLMPKNDGKSYYFYPVLGTNLYVDASAAAEGADGTEAHPYPTIQQAVDTHVGEVVVHVAEGVYDKGASYCGSASNRVHIAGYGGYGIRLIASGARDKTVIKGASDPSTADDPKYEGCGTNGCRCLVVDTGNAAIVQGFTLADGRSSLSPGNKDMDPAYAGGVFCLGTLYMTDCVISNCVASRGAAMYNGSYSRCRITRCRAFSNGVTRNCSVYGCLFEDNWGPDIVGNGTYATQTTAVTNNVNSNSGVYHYYMSAGSCGLVGGWNYGRYDTVNNSLGNGFSYSVFQNSAPNSKLLEGAVKADPMFVDPANRDWRVYSCGPAAHRLDPAAVYWLKFVCTDLTGQPFLFNADGTTVAGAFADVVPAAIGVSDRANGVSPSAVIPAAGHDSFTFSAAADRPLVGWAVNGVTNVTTERSWTVAYSPTLANGDVFRAIVTPVYGNVWYVDASRENDGGDGYTAANAKKTLAAVLAKAVEKGDVVKAAPGDYNSGSMQSLFSQCVLPSRAAVKSGVTLESTGGADVTFITGESDLSEATGDSVSGLGTNAMRCASVAGGATLRGFTLRGGRTIGTGPERYDVAGGGVFGGDSSNALVEDCVITDCCATRGGGVRYGTYVRCRFVGNSCTGNSPAARNASCYGCLADGNRQLNDNNFGTFYACTLVDCTVGEGNVTAGGADLYAFFNGSKTNEAAMSPYRVVNTLVCSRNGAWGGLYSNCVFRTGTTAQGQSTQTLYDNVNPIYGDVTVDERGVPAKSCAAVDAADESLDVRDAGAADLYGRQRVWNAKRDVGCCDYDWRGDFAAVLGRRAAVPLADPNVTFAADGDAVKILAGELDVRWTSSARKPRCYFTCKVNGTGALTVTLNGEVFRTLTADDGATTLDFKTALAENALAFSYEPGDGDSLGAEVSSFSAPLGTSVIIR